MIDAKIQHEITRQLERLPSELQQRVLDFAESLAGRRPRGEAGRNLLHFAGLLDRESAREIAAAIQAGCEQVDTNDW